MREEFYAHNEDGEEIIELTTAEIKEALSDFDEIIVDAVIAKLRAKYEEVCEWEMYGAAEFDKEIEEEALLNDTKEWLDHIFNSDDAEKDG